MFNLECEKDRATLKVNIPDNGHWEYDRVGFGEDAKGVFFIDLNDSGKILRTKTYLNKSYSLESALQKGVEMGVFEEVEGNFYLNIHEEEQDGIEKEEKAWNNFVTEIC